MSTMLAKLPVQFAPFFWDISLKDLDPERHCFFIIERLLEKGRWEGVEWVWQTYPPAKIAQVISTSRNVSESARGFWQAYFSQQFSHEYSSRRFAHT